MTTPQTARIRELNDLLRTTWLTGKVFMTEGIRGLSLPMQSRIAEQVQTFRDNDPHGEHDFGAFSVEARKVFWKIDYYAPDMVHGSENPADSTKTVRVLTIMLAEEY